MLCFNVFVYEKINMNELKKLVHDIHKSQAVDNLFFQKWMSNKFNIEDLAIFARNYWEWNFCFPEALAVLVANTKDITVRVEYTKILFSEMGNGNQRCAHSILFEEFCNKLAEKMGYPGYLNIENLKKNVPLLKETQNLNAWQKEMYSRLDIAAGAQLALEWQAYTMIRKLYDGARNYMDLWDNPDEFHEACEFFYVHIGAAEKEHKDESILAAKQLIDNGADIKNVEEGFCTNLQLIGDFWNGIAKSCSN